MWLVRCSKVFKIMIRPSKQGSQKWISYFPCRALCKLVAVYASKFLYYLRYNSMYVQLCLREQSQFHPSRITSKIGINDGRGQKCPNSNQSSSAIIKMDKNIKALLMHQLCSVFLRSSQSLFFNIYTLIWRFMNVNSHPL